VDKLTQSVLVSLSKLGKSPSSQLAKKLFSQQTSKEKQRFRAHRVNRHWLVTRRESLRKKYGDQYVVVFNRDIKTAYPTHAK